MSWTINEQLLNESKFEQKPKTQPISKFASENEYDHRALFELALDGRLVPPNPIFSHPNSRVFSPFPHHPSSIRYCFLSRHLLVVETPLASASASAPYLAQQPLPIELAPPISQP
jgi:hypothetical protein